MSARAVVKLSGGEVVFIVEIAIWKAAARRQGASLTDWMRAVLNVAAVPVAVPVAPIVNGDQSSKAE